MADGLGVNDERQRLAPRVVLVSMGMLFIISSAGYYSSSDVELFLPWLWPTWLGLAGLSCLAFAARPRSARMWNASRILVVIAVLSRSFSIILRAIHNTLPAAGAGLGAACVYMVGTFGLFALWSDRFRYWSQREAAKAAKG